MKDFSILGSLFRPHIWAIKYHESTAIFVPCGRELVFVSFAWCNLQCNPHLMHLVFVCEWPRRWTDGNFGLICLWLLHQCETRRFSWRQPDALARPEKKSHSIYRSQRSWRLSLIQRYLLKTYLWRWELKDQSPRFCHLNLTELTHVVSSGITTTSIRWWAKEESHSNVASVQSKRCKRTSSRLKLD